MQIENSGNYPDSGLFFAKFSNFKFGRMNFNLVRI